jgi:ferric-dicitrate binding protein FerR (iron transport regulator)
VRPGLAVVSAGADNPYGHPSPATVARLEARGTRVLRTDINGSVEIALTEAAVEVRTAGARPAMTAALADPGAPVTIDPRFACAIAADGSRVAAGPPLPSGR